MNTLIISPAPFHSFRRSKQFLALALARLGHHVGYVEPPVSPLSVIRQPSRLRDLVASTRSQPEAGIDLWQPRVVPGQNSAVGQRVNAVLLRRGITKLMPAPDITIAFSLESRAVLGDLPGVRVYYCTDSLEDNPGLSGEAIRRWEPALVAQADLVVACSLGLQRQFEARGIEAFYLPHGCEDSFFDPPTIPLPELVGYPRPYVGYIGGLNSRIDTELLEAARRGAMGGTLVIIGGRYGSHPDVDAAAARLLERPDVLVLGEKGPAELPSYLAALDVGVAPYLEDDFNRKSYPLKIPQYLAAGLAVVSTVNGATEELGNVIRVASSPAAFEAAVAEAIGDGAPARRAERRAVAMRRPWTVVAQELLAKCEPLAQRRRRPA